VSRKVLPVSSTGKVRVQSTRGQRNGHALGAGGVAAGGAHTERAAFLDWEVAAIEMLQGDALYSLVGTLISYLQQFANSRMQIGYRIVFRPHGQARSGGAIVMTSGKQVAAIFVDRSKEQWIVRDPAGNYWLIPSRDNAWDHRQPFTPTEATDLVPVPGHYKYMLELPF
jgi:hypothetical protein